MEAPELAEALQRAGKSPTAPIQHSVGDDNAFLCFHLEQWLLDTEAQNIVKFVPNDDGIEAWRQLCVRFEPKTALTKGARLRSVMGWAAKNKVKKNQEVPAIIKAFEKLLERYKDDFKVDAMTDDLKKQALLELIPAELESTVQDVALYRDMSEDTMTYEQVKGLVQTRIARDVQDLAAADDVAGVAKERVNLVEEDAEWANAVGKGDYGGKMGKGKGKDWKGSAGGGAAAAAATAGGKGAGGAGDPSGMRPAGACSHCWGFGHYYYACPVRLGPEGAAQAEKERAKQLAEKGKGKGKGKDWKGKGKGKGKVDGKGGKGWARGIEDEWAQGCLLYTSPSPRDRG